MIKKRILTGTLVCSIVAGNIFAAGTTVSAASVSNNQKEEVVYIMTDANGTVDNINVVNIFGKGDVTDFGNYSSVKMLTSTESISNSGDEITFSTNQDKVYYQGTIENAEIPWNIVITYSLDGKEVKPEELVGASGALKIHIEIKENTKCTTSFYNDYALQASLTLDGAQCENITADGATLANVGADKQISFTVLPGKGLDATITSDVTDFKMDAIAINGVKLNLNVEIDDAELMDKVTEIMDATATLNDGAMNLSDGTSQLQNGGSSLNSGADTLYNAVNSLDSGVATLSNGVTSMQTGLNTLDSKSAALTSGSTEVLTALTTIQSSLANVSVSTEQLKQLMDSSAAIKQGISDLYDGAVNLQTNLSYASYKAAMGANGLDIDTLKAGNTAAISSLTGQITSLSSSIETLKGTVGYDESTELQAQVAQLEAQIGSLTNIVTLLTGSNAAIGGTETYLTTVSAGVDSLVTGLSNLKTSYETFDAAIVSLSSTLSTLAVNMSSLKTGIDQLVTNYKTLDSGISEYTSGVATIVASYSQLVDGIGTLASGSKELLEGTGNLKQATSAMYDGIVAVCDGTDELQDGTGEFYDKTKDMDTQVEDSIDEMIASISGDETETVSFVSDKNTNVESVQFVIKTAAIEKKVVPETATSETVKMNFWQKLLHLFGLA